MEQKATCNKRGLLKNSFVRDTIITLYYRKSICFGIDRKRDFIFAYTSTNGLQLLAVDENSDRILSTTAKRRTISR